MKLSVLNRMLSRLFVHEEINGHELCPPYMHRWTLLRVGRRIAIYLHNFVGDDWSRDLHDHPKRFVSIGLWGNYVEETPAGERSYSAPWIRTFPANHIHRIRLRDGKPCWTLVIVFRIVRDWGFWSKGRWIHWKQYVGSEDAERAKNC